MADGYEIREAYQKWWVGKHVRTHPSREFKKVAKLSFCAPPSFFYGLVTLHYDDGTDETIGGGVHGFRPRKRDVEVMEV